MKKRSVRDTYKRSGADFRRKNIFRVLDFNLARSKRGASEQPPPERIFSTFYIALNTIRARILPKRASFRGNLNAASIRFLSLARKSNCRRFAAFSFPCCLNPLKSLVCSKVDDRDQTQTDRVRREAKRALAAASWRVEEGEAASYVKEARRNTFREVSVEVKNKKVEKEI